MASARKKKPSRNKLRRGLRLFLALVFVGGAIWRSWRIEKVVFAHTVQADPAELLKAAQVSPFSPFPIFRGALLRRLLQNPWVKEAAVKIELPHTLRFNLQERKPIFSSSTSSRTLTEDGYWIVPKKELPLPKLTVPKEWEERPLPQEVSSTLKELSELSSEHFLLTSARIFPSSHVELTFNGHILVQWGLMESLEKKRVVLQTLWRRFFEKGMKPLVVNLQSPQNPAVQFE